MPKLKIDGLEIEVPKGMKVIEAAGRLGIIIPRFCYHPGLGSVGACRMCAVKFLEGPVKGVQMSCMVDAQDGMVVSTTDEEVIDFRKHVIEWLMMNHPHDCPVCDEGGHCLLQDMTVSGGHGIRRYLGRKRTYHDQYLGVFVQHEMNRCIHCWRCRRFYQDFAGYWDLGAMQIGYHIYFGRFRDGSLESPFSGNIIDICPTGVYTDKPSRFKGRRWDFQRGPSLCIHCSLGCHTIASARYREIVRLEGHFNEWVNGYFICDRGRYGFYYTNHPERPRRAKIGREEVPWGKAIQTVAEKLSQVSQRHGPKSLFCLGSSRSSLENQVMLKQFCKLQGWQEPIYFEHPTIERKVKKTISRLDAQLAVSMREIEMADFILAVGADPVNEAPMLALAMRQAYRKGATIAAIDPRPIFLPFSFDHFPVGVENLDLCLSQLIKRTIDRSVAEGLGQGALKFYDSIPSEHAFDDLPENRFSVVEKRLQQSKFPVIVCGTEIVQETTPDIAADDALLFKAAKEKAGLFYLMPGANAFGAALLSPENGTFMSTVEAIENGTVKALLLVESDPFCLFPDQRRLEQAIQKLELLIVIDYLPSKVAQLAHLFLPSSPLFETETSFINQEGRIQFAPRAHSGGTPVEQLTAGDHPPRLFRNDIPGGESKAAWKILDELTRLMFPSKKELSREELWAWLSQENSGFANVQSFVELSQDVRFTPVDAKTKPFSLDWLANIKKGPNSGDGLELLFVDWTFGTEELSSYSQYIQQVEKSPCLFMSVKDAERMNLKDKDVVVLHLDGGSLEVELSVKESMAQGVIVLPRHHQLHWQKLKELPVRMPVEKIKKVVG